jgi:hypothetical protein
MNESMVRRYSLFVNGKALGPYERRTLIGMRVKGAITNDQLILREDGLELTIADLMDRRDETKPALLDLPDTVNGFSSSELAAPSTGMWPRFNVYFGGDAAHPGACGFIGEGHITYYGDVLRLSGRRKKNKEHENLPMASILSSMADGYSLELYLVRGLALPESVEGRPVCLTCDSETEATEIWELLNMASGELPASMRYEPTQTSPLR